MRPISALTQLVKLIKVLDKMNLRTRYRMGLKISLFAALVGGLSPFAQGGATCEKLLSDGGGDVNHSHSRKSTESLIGYLNLLIDKKVIGEMELKRLIQALGEDHMINPIDEDQALLDSSLFIHREGLEKKITNQKFDFEILKSWAELKIREQDRNGLIRENVRDQTQSTQKNLGFVRVPAGNFLMGGAGDQVLTELTHPIEMGATLMTQAQWVALMGANPSFHIERRVFPELHESVEVKIKGQAVMLQPDLPVENITWWSALVAANELSKLHGLPPVYDLSSFTFTDSSLWNFPNNVLRGESEILRAAARGGLAPLDPHHLVKINAPEGDIYQAKGFRLPTEAEQEFVRRGAPQKPTERGSRFFFGDDPVELDKYAWYGRPGEDIAPRPVAELKPFEIDGKGIYDLFGNLWEWSQDANISSKPKGGLNPVTDGMEVHRIIRGGGIWSPPLQLEASKKSYAEPGSRYRQVGVRFVRTLE